jgi:hypothetical protein
MSKRNESDRRSMSEKGRNKRVGASVLIAAASLLGTSLGVSAATPAEPLAPDVKDSVVDQSAVETSRRAKNLLKTANSMNGGLAVFTQGGSAVSTPVKGGPAPAQSKQPTSNQSKPTSTQHKHGPL